MLRWPLGGRLVRFRRITLAPNTRFPTLQPTIRRRRDTPSLYCSPQPPCPKCQHTVCTCLLVFGGGKVPLRLTAGSWSPFPGKSPRHGYNARQLPWVVLTAGQDVCVECASLSTLMAKWNSSPALLQGTRVGRNQPGDRGPQEEPGK